MCLFSDIVAQRVQILVEKPLFIIKPYGNRKSFLEILPPPCLSHIVCVCVCVLSLYPLYVSGMLRHGGIVYSYKTEKVGEVLTFISNK